MLPDLTAAGGAAPNLPRLAVLSAVLGVAAMAALTPLGYLAMALFGCLGLGLGMLNMVLVRRAAAQFADSEDPSQKGRFAIGVLGRLAVITVLAVALALLVRPAGLGVFGGLVAFQVLMIFSAGLPLLRELRSGVRA